MARQFHKREDLLVEATAYIRRCKLILAGDERSPWGARLCECFIGFRKSDAISCYFDESPVFQFNDLGELRRLFWEDRKIVASGGRLVELVRDTSTGRVRHVEQPMDETETQCLLAAVTQYLGSLLTALSEHRYQLVGVVGFEERSTDREREWYSDVIGGLSRIANLIVVSRDRQA